MTSNYSTPINGSKIIICMPGDQKNAIELDREATKTNFTSNQWKNNPDVVIDQFGVATVLNCTY